MSVNVAKEVAALQRMTTKELRERYAEVFGETTTTGNRTWLVRRIAWRLTVHIEGVAVTRSDVGSPSEQSGGGDRLKAAFSDSLKRTAVKFGIGRYLYAIPAIWMDYDPTTKRIVVRPTASPVEAARQRFTAARSTDALAREWEATPPDLRSQLVADKERRKKELAAG